ncbi:cyclic nucleotide-binding protein [Halomonas cupida]|uniref:CBS domain-containing protein n=1 Tax=Halomonas cupida TaxID=44933 RepID=A0A1M7HGJ1_9GAMM|nr:putative nucleotidyltransferase substrate binding domain-containing protein [Halomonas cupida]GEN25470.1 cyclic nucleotide-binding protein [Halomonas cupida]SHM27564.1 CBS domain-containing protein [Halomonas cupida]
MVDLDMSEPPFSLLNDSAREHLRAGLDLAYFARDTIILDAGQPGEFVFVIHKGEVAELDINEAPERSRIGHYTDGDLFGAISVLNGTSRYRFIAEQESLCYLMPGQLFLSLCDSEPAFAEYFRNRIAEKTRLMSQRRSQEDVSLADFMVARVSECQREPLVVASTTSIGEAVRILRDRQADSLLVEWQEGLVEEDSSRPGKGYGMVTRTDMLESLVLEGADPELALSAVASRDLVGVEAQQYLFEALIEMTRHKVARVVVWSGGQLVGIVELTDVLSFFSSRSYVVSLQVEQASDLDDLRAASQRVPEMLDSLMARGVRMRFAMSMLAALNGRIIHKAWGLSMAEPQRSACCLLLLGSEGRGEQVSRTDQDNALILADGCDWPNLADDATHFTNVLAELGYPHCSGHIMISNPQWVGTLTQWQKRVRSWVAEPGPDNLMQLSILMDACSVAGDLTLGDRLRDILITETRGNEVLLSHFARAVLQFSTPLTLFGSLKRPEHGIDLKKGGIFPIVHGVRSLALERGIRATSTLERLEALVIDGRVERRDADDLGEALQVFSELRWRTGGSVPDINEGGANRIVVQSLSSLERDLLREALHIVREFKGRLSHRYHLEYA